MKLEAFMVHLIITSIDEETKKNMKLPTISMFDVVEEDEYYWFYTIWTEFNELQLTGENNNNNIKISSFIWNGFFSRVLE